jgi:hypothetical protein
MHGFGGRPLRPACQPKRLRAKAGAGEGNRTLVISLEGCCSTIELHPRQELTSGIRYQAVAPAQVPLPDT